MYDYFSPAYEIEISGYKLSNGVAFEVYSSSKSAFDWAEVRLTDQIAKYLQLDKMNKIDISIGYADQREQVFGGYIEKNLNNSLVCKDSTLLLHQAKLTETFINVDPSELIAYGLNMASINKYVLRNGYYPKKERLAVSNKSVIELFKLVNQSWGLNEKYFFIPDGTFYWGEVPVQNKVTEFVYQENIISMRNEASYWVLTSIATPQVRHTNTISVVHPKLQGEFVVEKLRHYTNANGFLRTDLYFREVA